MKKKGKTEKRKKNTSKKTKSTISHHPVKASEEPTKTILEPPHHLEKLSTRGTNDEYIIELRSKGYTYDQIKKETKYSKSKISVILKRYVLQAQQNANLSKNPSLSKGEVQSRIFHYAPEALENIKRLSRRSKKDEVKLSASKDIMDRAGFKPVEKHALIHFVDTLNRSELMDGIMSILNGIRSRDNGSSVMSTGTSTGTGQP